MSLRQVEKLYKKMVRVSGVREQKCRIDAGVRAEIFQKIMDDLDRLMPKIRRCSPDSTEYDSLDHEIRRLLLKEIQVIIDDYVVACENGAVDKWKKKYGRIEDYKADFYRYRNMEIGHVAVPGAFQYGIYNQNIQA